MSVHPATIKARVRTTGGGHLELTARLDHVDDQGFTVDKLRAPVGLEGVTLDVLPARSKVEIEWPK